MPSPLVTTIGDATANSYVDMEQADAYFDDRLDISGWDDVGSDDRQRALLQAAKRLNRENWLGDRVKQGQSLAWPRAGVIKTDGAGIGSIDYIPGAGASLYPRTGYGIYWGGYGEQYSSTEIPQEIKDAQCELALAYLEGFEADDGETMDSFSQDGVSVKLRQTKPDGGLPPRVSQLIGGLIAGNRLVRG